jgi:hypothetical protein
MKKFSVTVLSALLLGANSIYAQTQPQNKTEYEKQIIKSNSAVGAKKYLSSLQALGKAKEEIDSLLKADLNQVLPAKLGEWVLSYSEKEEQNVTGSMKPSADLFSWVRVYTIGAPKKEIEVKDNKPAVTPPDPKGAPVKTDETPVYATPITETPRIIVTISNYNGYTLAVERVYNPSEDGEIKMVSPLIETTKFTTKGNRTVFTYNKDSNYGDLIVNIGNANVRIVGYSVPTSDTLKNLAEAINYDILKKVLQ